MAMVLNNGICQCCSSEGTFKNVESKYHWMGEEEVYADMLNECFNITLYVEGCEDSGICELCITQLRNAVNFKKLVLHTQQQFLKAINDKTLQVIKIEKLKSDEEMEDSSDHFADDDDLGDSDFVPELKEEKAEEESETKNRVRSTASKSKVNNPGEKKTTVKRPGKKITVKPDEETKLSMRNLKDYEKDKCNLRSILSHSNASPVAHKSTDGYSCSVCPEKFNEPANLKQHFLEEHNTEKAILHVIRKISDRAIKLDITKLCCSLCNRNLSDLEDLIKHLKNEHNKDVYTDVKRHIIPLKFDSPVLRCAICMKECYIFQQLVEHMNVHYNNYVCDTCNACFVTEPRFRCHLKVHEAGAYKCEQCDKVFQNPTKRTYHFRKMHLGIRKRQACTRKTNVTIKPWREEERKSKLSMSNLKNFEKNKRNLRSILSHSNASPVARKGTDGYSCSVCPKKFEEPPKLKQHFLEEHDTEKAILHIARKISDRAVKLDVTKLCCSLCNRNLSDLEDLIKHLKNEHNKDMYTDVKSHIIPLKFDSPVLRCAICMKEYHTFQQLVEHMNVHYNNYVCETCNACFVTEPRFRCHVKGHETGAYKCEHCDKVFQSVAKRMNHLRRSHLGLRKRHGCNFCDGIFKHYYQKAAHMVEEHDVTPAVLNCNACERTFKTLSHLKLHTRKYHLMEKKYECADCEMTFFDKISLRKHIERHTGEKKFQCDICFKKYARPYTLREHMRIHRNDKILCDLCDEAFVFKSSWKVHMRLKHGEFV